MSRAKRSVQRAAVQLTWSESCCIMVQTSRALVGGGHNTSMRSIGAYEAKTKLSMLLDAVEKGESYTITRNGRPVARLSPVSERSNARIEEAIAQLLKFREEHVLGIGVREALEQGRRY